MLQTHRINLYSHLLEYGLPGNKHLSILHSMSEIIKITWTFWGFFFTLHLILLQRAGKIILITLYEFYLLAFPSVCWCLFSTALECVLWENDCNESVSTLSKTSVICAFTCSMTSAFIRCLGNSNISACVPRT